MKLYRMAVDAVVCFDISAESEAEARQKAEAAVALAGGDQEDELDGLKDAKAYLGGPSTIETQWSSDTLLEDA